MKPAERSTLLRKHAKGIKDTAKRTAYMQAIKGLPQLIRTGHLNRWETGRRLSVIREGFTRKQFIAFLFDCERVEEERRRLGSACIRHGRPRPCTRPISKRPKPRAVQLP
jgi:hypothetical protein